MNAIIPLALDTLSSAALIFFAAVGLTLVFNVLRVLNVAHGSFYSIGAYAAASLCLFIVSRQLNPYLSFVALLFSAVLVAVILGPLIESTLIRWTYGKSEAVQILITFGLFLILEDVQRIVFGVQSLYEDMPMRLMGSTAIGGIVYLNYQIALIGMAVLVVIGLRLLIKHSRLEEAWGARWLVHAEDGLQVTGLTIRPGAELPRRGDYRGGDHRWGAHWLVVSGVARVTRGDEVLTVQPHQSIFIPPQTPNRLANQGNAPLVVVEVQSEVDPADATTEAWLQDAAHVALLRRM